MYLGNADMKYNVYTVFPAWREPRTNFYVFFSTATRNIMYILFFLLGENRALICMYFLALILTNVYVFVMNISL